MSAARVTAVRLERTREPMALGVDRPRVSWQLEQGSDGGRVTQTTYELEVLRSDGSRHRVLRLSAEQVLVEWPFEPLRSRERASLRVRVTGADGLVSDWSDAVPVEAGLLDPADWAEPFASPSVKAGPGEPRPAYLMRAAVELPDQVVAARLHTTARGIAVWSVNGRSAGDDLLSPGWTSYPDRLRVRSYDVTALLNSGENVIGAQLADGWFRGNIGFNGGVWDHYGRDASVLAQLEVATADGAWTRIPMAERWRCAEGPVVAAGLYTGEVHDARKEPAGWDQTGFDDSGWDSATAIDPAEVTTARLEPAASEPIRVTEVLTPVTVERRPNGRLRLDFGQNLVGMLRLRVSGPRGHTVRLHHAEVLDGAELAVAPLRRAVSVDEYTLRGGGEEVWSPRFTYHGFRFAEVENWPGEFVERAVEALVVHSDMTRVGSFDCSDPLLSKLHENIAWSLRGNFVGLPTDCPQRDERLGWTGDIQVFAATATDIYDCDAFLADWLVDLAEQSSREEGVPNYVPFVPLGFPWATSAAWGDAAVIVPWTLWERYGDALVLRDQWQSMVDWVEFCASARGGSGLIDSGPQLGDWLDPTAPPDAPQLAATDPYVVANAYLAHSARLTSRAAQVLGDAESAERYAILADDVTEAFCREYLPAEGWGVLDTPTALTLGIAFDLLGDRRQLAGARLAELVASHDHRIATGFVGTPYICDALADTGQVDAAYGLLLQPECPSWLYQVRMGATTTWERWDSLLEDGSVNPGEMTSFNHYALGAVGDFLYRRVAGIAPAAPGYRRVRIAPAPTDRLRSASASVATPYGTVAVSWRVEGGELAIEVEVPAGARAELALPGDPGAPVELAAGRHHRAVPWPPAG